MKTKKKAVARTESGEKLRTFELVGSTHHERDLPPFERGDIVAVPASRNLVREFPEKFREVYPADAKVQKAIKAREALVAHNQGRPKRVSTPNSDAAGTAATLASMGSRVTDQFPENKRDLDVFFQEETETYTVVKDGEPILVTDDETKVAAKLAKAPKKKKKDKHKAEESDDAPEAESVSDD